MTLSATVRLGMFAGVMGKWGDGNSVDERHVAQSRLAGLIYGLRRSGC